MVPGKEQLVSGCTMMELLPILILVAELPFLSHVFFVIEAAVRMSS